MNLDGVEQQALANFADGADNYDDGTFDSFAGKGGGRVARKASFDLIFNNPSGEALTVELFNATNTFTEKQNVQLVNSATVLLIPHTSFEGSALSRAGIVGFRSNGDLILTGASAAVACTVNCPQLSYKSLLKESGRKGFKITAIRMTVVNDAQISNEIVMFSKSFLGSSSRNSLSPRTSLRPDQFQTKIVDVPMDFLVNGNSGLEYKINAGETVTWNVVIEAY
jgi:hypothetical protein